MRTIYYTEFEKKFENCFFLNKKNNKISLKHNYSSFAYLFACDILEKCSSSEKKGQLSEILLTRPTYYKIDGQRNLLDLKMEFIKMLKELGLEGCYRIDNYRDKKIKSSEYISVRFLLEK